MTNGSEAITPGTINLPANHPDQEIRTGIVEPTLSLSEANEKSKYVRFCEMVGLMPSNAASQIPNSGSEGANGHGPPQPDAEARALKPVPDQLFARILRAYHYHTLQYWFVATLVNMLYLSQIAIGATATALGSIGLSKNTKLHTTATTILTAIGTVVAGVLAFIKSRGQPMRVRKLRNDLRAVCELIRFKEIEFIDPECKEDVNATVAEVIRLYNTARANAETNYPESWSISPDPRKVLPSVTTRDTTRMSNIHPGEPAQAPQNQTSGPPSPTNATVR